MPRPCHGGDRCGSRHDAGQGLAEYALILSLIVIFSVSVIGLTLITGVDPNGQPARISLFESFYFMSYTATTIGFGKTASSSER